MASKTLIEFRTEIKALSKLLNSKKNASSHWALYSYLLQTQYKISPEDHGDVADIQMVKGQWAKLSQNTANIKTWLCNQPSILNVKARKIDEILIKLRAEKRLPSSRQKALFYEFMKTLDVACIGLHYLSVRHNMMLSYESIEFDKLVTWFVENVADMDISKYMLYATDATYAWNGSLLRDRMSKALDADFEAKKLTKKEKADDEIKTSDEWYDACLDVLLNALGETFDETSAGLGIEVRWVDIKENQKEIFAKDEFLYEKFCEMVEVMGGAGKDSKEYSYLLADVYVYIANTTCEIIEDEITPGTDPRAEQVDEVMCHIFTQYSRAATTTEAIN
jgi:hypothetical protein